MNTQAIQVRRPTLRRPSRAIVLSQIAHEREQAMGLGAVNPSFYVPSGMTPTSASPALLSAVNDLLTSYSANGVPSEHSSSPQALAVQTAWDNDAIVIAAGASAMLDQDESYGPNTHDAVAAVNGGTAPDVNTSAPTSAPVPTTVVVNQPTPAPSTDWTRPLLIGAAIVAVAGVGTAAILHTQKHRARTRATHRPTMPHGHRPAYT